MIIIINLCLMRMAGNNLHLLLIVLILVFSNFFFLDAVPIFPRGRNLLHASQDIVASRSIHRASTKQPEEEELTHGRNDLEFTDYPGSGANNHHTPTPPAVKV
ncbi:hypothetical protein ACB094_03G176000 [Castanea mollissima]